MFSCISGAELGSPGPSSQTVTGVMWCENLSERKMGGFVLLHTV